MIKQLLKNRMSKFGALLMLMVEAVFPQKASAYDFEVNGIYYNLVDGEAEVTTPNDYRLDYKGDVSIPSEVEYNGVLYSVTSIGVYAFYCCSNLNSVTIPESVTSVGAYAFFQCYSLTSITIPEGVTSIGDSAFGECHYLTSVTIPESVISIGVGAFSYCYFLASVTIPESVTSIGAGAFYNCSRLTSINIPEGVTSIGYMTFYNCFSLTSITIPKSVTSIGDEAFCSCSGLSSITIPKRVTSIGERAFYDCKSLNEVICLAAKPCSLGADVFVHSPSSKTLYVPRCSVDDYRNSSWSNYFSTIVVGLTIKEDEASLTVKGAETHSLTLYYKEDTEAKIDVRPEVGWKLYSLSFNGEDVTNDVSGGTYTTPALSGDNYLEVVMKSDVVTGVDGAVDAHRKISFRKNGNTVEILNLEEGERITIYNADGVCEYQGKNHTVTLSNNNVYILRTEKETLKFAL